jgi:hypothetical protein
MAFVQIIEFRAPRGQTEGQLALVPGAVAPPL